MRKDFRKHNQPFLCLKCGHENPPALSSERNHCRACLYSLHVDDETPGDRTSSCGGLMEPVRLDHKGAKGFMLIHRCINCRKEMANRLAEDDNMNVIPNVSGANGGI